MTSPLELAATAALTVSIVLAGRNSVHTWWTGIAACALFAALFHGAKLYADVLLQLFFIATSACGWWRWRRGRQGHELPVAHAPARTVARCLAAGALATLAYGGLLHAFSDAYAPFVDSAVLAFSVVAQLLLMQRRVESWPFWLLVNSIAVPLYASRGLFLTAALYAAYGLNALYAWWTWHRLARPSPQPAPAPAPAGAGAGAGRAPSPAQRARAGGEGAAAAATRQQQA